jgi:hypothetical protein
MHSGTTDFNKISNFAKLLYGISRAKGLRFMKLDCNDNTKLLKSVAYLGAKSLLSQELKDYVMARIAQFNPSLITNAASIVVNEELSEEMPPTNHWVEMAESTAISSELPF